MDRFVCGLLMFFLIAALGFGIRQELINSELKQQNALQKVQIDELMKNQRLTAQDVGMIEKLIIEGKK
ncbi:MAG: hypothetical protein IKY09_02575 [Methanocorpusculum sp.]|nr:hypothetical protein [Methanocorpusculum sp.]MBR5450198.1 hypothetical protein [Methanocorpusculum sp.]